jgi:hypothetical protein
MAKNAGNGSGLALPTAAMIFCGIASALIVGGSFWIITVWPRPQAVEPYFGFDQGWIWGAVFGALFGLIIGFLTDERHFADSGDSAAQ